MKRTETLLLGCRTPTNSATDSGPSGPRILCLFSFHSWLRKRGAKKDSGVHLLLPGPQGKLRGVSLSFLRPDYSHLPGAASGCGFPAGEQRTEDRRSWTRTSFLSSGAVEGRGSGGKGLELETLFLYRVTLSIFVCVCVNP